MPEDVPTIDVSGLAPLLEAGAFVLDVRRPDEYEAAHVPGAVLVPLDQLVERVDEVPEGQAVYVICQTGARSARAAMHLNSMGKDATNVAGGTKAWINDGRAVATGPLPG